MVETPGRYYIAGEGRAQMLAECPAHCTPGAGYTVGLESFPVTALRGKWPWVSYLASVGLSCPI